MLVPRKAQRPNSSIVQSGGAALLDNARNCYWRTKGALAPAGQTKSAFLLVVGTPAGVTNKIKDLQWISEVESSPKIAQGRTWGRKAKEAGPHLLGDFSRTENSH